MPLTIDAAVTRGNIFNIRPEDILIDEELTGRYHSPDGAYVTELAASIARDGQLEPVLCRRDDKNQPVLVFGRYRLEAIKSANEAKLTEEPLTVRAEVRDMSEEEAYLAAVAENDKRRAPSAMDRASQIEILADRFKKLYKEIAKIYGQSPAWVSQTVKLLELPANLQRRVHKGEIPATVGYELAMMDPEERDKFVEEMDSAGSDAQPTREQTKRKARRARGVKVSLTIKQVRSYFVDLSEVQEGEEATELEKLAGHIVDFIDGKIGDRAMTKRFEEAL